MKKLDSNIIWQIAIVTRDIEKYIQNYTKLFGLHKPEVIQSGVEDGALIYYKGKPTNAIHKLAFFKMGMIQLELIEPNDAESTWRDYLEEHGEGVHHIGIFTDNINNSLEFLKRKNITYIQKGDFGFGVYYYMDSRDALGITLALSEKYKLG